MYRPSTIMSLGADIVGHDGGQPPGVQLVLDLALEPVEQVLQGELLIPRLHRGQGVEDEVAQGPAAEDPPQVHGDHDPHGLERGGVAG